MAIVDSIINKVEKNAKLKCIDLFIVVWFDLLMIVQHVIPKIKIKTVASQNRSF